MMPGLDLGCELQKLPNLLEHYQEHKACNDNSFLIFLINDFFHADDLAQDHEDSEHENLPFHGNHNCCHPTSFYANQQHFSITAWGFNTPHNFGFYNITFSTLFLDSPFQPPQI